MNKEATEAELGSLENQIPKHYGRIFGPFVSKTKGQKSQYLPTQLEVNNSPTELCHSSSYAPSYYFYRVRFTNVDYLRFEEKGKVLVVR